MKFDVVVGNPPYKRGLHIKIIEKGIDLTSGYAIFIHPSMWMRLLRESKSKRVYNNFKDKLRYITHSIKTINAKLWFDIVMRIPLAIIHIDKSKNDSRLIYNGKTIDTIDNANHIGEWSVIKSIEEKVLSQPGIKDVLTTEKGRNWYVSLTSICGHGCSTYTYDDGVTRKHENKHHLINSKTKTPLNEPHRSSPMRNEFGNIKQSVPFDTWEEANDFITLLNTSTLIRYLCITYIEGQHSTSVFPYIPLSIKDIHLTEQEQEHIIRIINEHDLHTTR